MKNRGEEQVPRRVYVHGANHGLVCAERVRYLVQGGGRGGVREAEPVPLRVPLLVPPAARAE